MNPFPTLSARSPKARTQGAFTLVELLVVITIIGLLAGLGIPAVMSAIGTAKDASIKMEVTALGQAIEQYRDKYGDYPPDFSDWNVVQRHYKKAFPRISPAELNLLQRLCDVTPGNDTAVAGTAATAHDPAAIDRSEALAFALLGFSDNIQLPFTGADGPLQLVSSTTTSVIYQINSEHPNRLFDFSDSGLNYTGFDPAVAVSASNRYVSADDNDLFLNYATDGAGSAPLVYFDSRTYDYQVPAGHPTLSGQPFNGYAAPDFGGIRPLLSDNAKAVVRSTNYASPLEALRSWQFEKPDSFQIISAGRDGKFSSIIDGTRPSLFFQYPSGRVIDVTRTSSTPEGLRANTSKGYQESIVGGDAENNIGDNLTNFATGQLVNDVKE